MESFMTQWGLILKAFGITVSLLVIRLVFDYLNFDILSVTNLITAFIGVPFLLSQLFSPAP